MSILHEAGIKTARRNINSLRHTDIILMAESEEKLKLPLMRVKEESEKAGLKFNIKKINNNSEAHGILVPLLHGT